MFYVPFHHHLPEVAEAETRTIMVVDDYSGKLPPGNYGLIEYYCETPDCDCRRVLIHVMSERMRQVVAIINFGWESKKFYEKWLGFKDEGIMKELMGPCLNSDTAQSPYASELLAIVRDDVLKDRHYTDRIKRHYDLFKKQLKHTETREEKAILAVASVKIGRNEACTCGSGQKYKKCCGRG